MSIVAEFTVPAPALPGGKTLTEMPGITVELERIVPTRECALPFFWVWGNDPMGYIERVGEESAIEEVELLDRVENGALFRSVWKPEAVVIQGIQRLDATIIEATGTAEHWRFQVRTQEREAFVDFQKVFREEGIPVALERLYDLSELVEGEHRTLTDEQRDALITAYQEGYFDKPRSVTQAELGEQFGISHRAVSERLRRGTRNLVASSLLPSGNTT